MKKKKDLDSKNNLSRFYNVNEILNKLKIKSYELIGDISINFNYPSAIWDGKKGSITFCSKSKIQDTIRTINNSKASVIITNKDINLGKLKIKNKIIVMVDNPRDIFIKILNYCFPIKIEMGKKHPSSIIDINAIIHSSVNIGANCVIGKCKIGANSIIYPNVVVNDNVVIGENVIINPGTVIGFDGFGYQRNEKKELIKFPHYGGVVIEDDVEIGSNVSIDRGSLNNTIIKKGSKIDNLCHIAHNVTIGKNSAVIALAMVGGSTKIGNCSWIAPGSALIDGIEIGNNALIGMGAVVIKDVPDNSIVVGNPAIPLEQFKEIHKRLKNQFEK